MAVRALSVAGYRSIRTLHLELGPVEVVVGPNGSGKSNLYRALGLLQHAAAGRLASALLDEGGTESAMWAGARRKNDPVRIQLGVELEDVGYSLEIGLPPPVPPTPFSLDPEVKREIVTVRSEAGTVPVMERKATAWARDAEGVRVSFPFPLWSSESALVQIREQHRFPLLSVTTAELLAWRFYHTFRTDPQAPARWPRPGVRTPVLAHDGADLAAALCTIEEIGDGEGLHRAVAEAFPGARLKITQEATRFGLELTTPGLARPLTGAELSDGTLRYLSLVAALMSPRPAPFLVLNEPETSVHPGLFLPLARLIAGAARTSQVLVTTHAAELAAHLVQLLGVTPIELQRERGETLVVGASFQGRRRRRSGESD